MIETPTDASMSIGALRVIVDAEHLKALSGLKKKSAVARWCRRSGIQFFLNAGGWPVTIFRANGVQSSDKDGGPLPVFRLNAQFPPPAMRSRDAVYIIGHACNSAAFTANSLK